MMSMTIIKDYKSDIKKKAYYIYKITPLWKAPMEKTEYRPIFFENHPELKKKWEKLVKEEAQRK